jgi:4-amino-4-deoxy-L-arabinose transferase-like glycosyltransferase
MKKYLSYILLGLIVLIAIATRLYKLGAAPAGLYVDEAGQGYSAYSILKTGKDEFGKSFPIVFRSLTDFKTPVYIYLIVPLIPKFGLNAFTVRFPSFLFSIMTIPILYFLIKELFKRDKVGVLALITSLLLAISPWHILFGRTNFECNVALFFFLSGVLAFYKSLKRPYLLLASAVLFAIAIPAYHSQRIITPLMLIVLFIRFRKILLDKAHRSYLIASAVVGLIFSSPTLSVALTPGFLARASGLNIFSHLRQMPAGFIESYKGLLYPIINGSWFLTTREFLSLYFSYFSPRFIFNLGDYGPRSSFPELATFFIWQFPFYIYGLWILFKRKNLGELKFFTIATLLISPIPAAVTRDPYTTIRALSLVVPQIIIVSCSIYDIFQRIKDQKWQIGTVAIIVLLVVYSLFKLYSSVIILNEYYRAKYWDYGWQQVMEVVGSLHTDLPVTIDNARSDPDLQVAFFLKYDPSKYQKENVEIPLSEYYTNLYRNPIKNVGNITIHLVDWRRDLPIDQYLVGDELGISTQQISEHKLELVSEIHYPDGTIAYRIVRTNPPFEKEQQKIYNLKFK